MYSLNVGLVDPCQGLCYQTVDIYIHTLIVDYDTTLHWINVGTIIAQIYVIP